MLGATGLAGWGGVAVRIGEFEVLKGEPWEILECTCSLAEAAQLLQASPSATPSKL